MRNSHISIRGAREHNLKEIDLNIPRDKLVVITGVSGSGKSSLAFDTIYAEGQRRYIESLSAYARQFLEQMEKPEVEAIEGLPPTISIEQRSGSSTPRSVVATSTEIYDYLRVLFARIGHAHCYKCGKEIRQQTSQQIIDQVLQLPPDSKIVILAPIIRGKKGRHREVFERIRREGFIRVRVNGRLLELAQAKRLRLDRYKKHNIEIVVDRLVIDKEVKNRLADSIELALRFGEGLTMVAREPASSAGRDKGKWTDMIFSQHYACPGCGVSMLELSPRMFSFNSPYGACPTCNGLGTKMELDAGLIVPDKTKSLREGAVEAWRRLGHRMSIYYYHVLRDFARNFKIDMDEPFSKLPEEQRRVLLHGSEKFEGVIPMLQRRFQTTTSDYIKRKILDYMSELPCPVCDGARLKPEPLAVLVGGRNIHEVTGMTIETAVRFFSTLKLNSEESLIAQQVLKEIKARLEFLMDVGLGYLTLDRKSSTLAGGEAQRIRLASQIGSGLVGVCYVLDEPTIGLHQSDNQRLLRSLKRLRDLGNTVLIVEHDEDTIRESDYLIDIGPGAGAHGGKVVVQGPIDKVLKQNGSLTVKYLNRQLTIDLPRERRGSQNNCWLEIKGARENNLKNVNVKIPVGCFCCVTGVSGSGKSTLVDEVLYKGLRRRLYQARERPGTHDTIEGIDHVDKVIVIDQSPIGRTPRSNPATYTGVFDEVRRLFAMVKEARLRGYQAGRFSFNLKGGRCESCEGQGTKIIEMHFLPDVHIVCEECKGRRYNRETLEIKYKGNNIAEVLDMEVTESLEFFQNFPKIERMLRTLDEVGLGYINLGQSSTTLSGGEAQRVKLATELGKSSTGHTLYILDEPTTGLHYSDMHKLLKVLARLVSLGNTVVVIEHNMHVIKMADYIVDLGPGGGEHGGKVVVTGTPEEVAKNSGSVTGKILAKYLAG